MDRHGDSFTPDPRNAARRGPESDVPIFDLTPYEQSADAGVLAGPTRSRFEQVPVGAAAEAAEQVATMPDALRTTAHCILHFILQLIKTPCHIIHRLLSP